jgi:2'-5' RNA ligase
VSPLPRNLADRWRDGRGDADADSETLYWHVLLGHDPQLRSSVRSAQARIARFPGLHMTPLQWLHLTVLIVGRSDQIPDQAIDEMLRVARSLLSRVAPITVEFSHILYHPEAIMLAAHPADALGPVREAARQATQAVSGHEGALSRSSRLWIPHVTLCYSTSDQPAEPIIAALGKNLPSCHVSVDTLSLVIQRGPEWLWDWVPAGAALLGSLLLARCTKAHSCRSGLPS